MSTTGLLAKSLVCVEQQSPGFIASNVLTAQFSLTGPSYDGPDKRAAFINLLLDHVRALPGVAAAATTSILPFTPNNAQGSYRIEGRTPPVGQPEPHGQRSSVSPDYFQTVGIPLLRGRYFTARDDARAPGVVIIDRVLADRYWPQGDPLGQKILGGDGPGERAWTIVGVVASAKRANLEDPVTKETLYFPVLQAPESYGALVVKTAVASATIVASLRAAVAATDPDQPLYNIKTLTTLIDESLWARRVPAELLSFSAAWRCCSRPWESMASSPTRSHSALPNSVSVLRSGRPPAISRCSSCAAA